MSLVGKEYIRKGLKYQEEALQMNQALFPGNHPEVAIALINVGCAYKILGDKEKALEYFKQAYSIYSAMLNEDDKEARQIKLHIESLQPYFFTQSSILQQYDCLGGNQIGLFECRWIITSRRGSNDNQKILKQQIQKNILNNLVEIVDRRPWSTVDLPFQQGVKIYIKKIILKRN